MNARNRYRDDEDDPLDERMLAAMGVGPRPRRRRGAVTRLARLLVGAAAAAATVGLLALYAPRERGPADEALVIGGIADRPAPVLTAPPAQWRTLARPLITLGLDAYGFAGLPKTHVARASADGTLEDSLVFGAFDEPGTHLRLMLARNAPEAALRPFFVETALVAAEAGLALARSGQPAWHESRLGPLEIAALELENGPVRACLAFRGGAELRLSGWLCAADAAPADLVCTIERLVLLDDGGDARLAAAFGERAGPSWCRQAPLMASLDETDRAGLGSLLAESALLPPPRPTRTP